MKDHNPNDCPHCNPKLFYMSVVYNYKCPSCNGEFNQPAYHCSPSTSLGTLVTYHCPFCNFHMKGF